TPLPDTTGIRRSRNGYKNNVTYKWLIIFFFIIHLPLSLHSTDLSTITGRLPIPGPWRIMFRDNIIYSETEFDDSSWQKTDLPYSPVKDNPDTNNYMWLRNTFIVDTYTPDKKIFLLSGKLEGAIEYYLNGILIGFHGNFPPQYQHHETSTKQFIIPGQLLRLNQKNVISIRIYNKTGLTTIPQIYFGDYASYLFDSQFIDFLSVKIYLVYSIVSLLLGVYFIFQFAFRQKERPNLFFSLTNFCFCIYFLNMGLEVHFLPFTFAGMFSQSFLPLFFGFLLLFFLNFFNIHNNTWFKRIIMGVALVLFSLFYLNIGEEPIIPNLFTYVLLPCALELIFMVYISIRATITKKKNAVPIMIGALIGFLLGIYDMGYQFMGLRPLFWLQGTGIFCFNISMFIALSLKSIQAYKDLEVYSSDIIRKSEELTCYIRDISDVTNTVSRISSQLEETILSTSGSIEKMATGSMSISEGINDQFAIVKKTNDTVLSLLNSLEDIYTGLTSQFNHVRETSSTVEQMITNISDITQNLKNTKDFAETLKTITKKGENIVLTSSQSVQDIITVSEDAHKIIDAVSDLAEQTNILAINASIEAAHAGQYGAGFAVVAGEIKRLAAGSSHRSAEILGRIKEIINKIEQGSRTNNDVKDVFEEIHNKTSSTVNQIQSIYSAILTQKTSSERVLHSISQLNIGSQNLKEQTDKQESSGKIIRNNIEKLVHSSQVVFENVNKISKEIEEIVRSTNNIKTIAGESITLIARLKDILERK
ncbi:MAG: hypothetical protein JXJ04_07510, partial [Spirochaetales bacterium]|nr:hypothetical protein [Spirochaetales bacterium]